MDMKRNRKVPRGEKVFGKRRKNSGLKRERSWVSRGWKEKVERGKKKDRDRRRKERQIGAAMRGEINTTG